MVESLKEMLLVVWFQVGVDSPQLRLVTLVYARILTALDSLETTIT